MATFCLLKYSAETIRCKRIFYSMKALVKVLEVILLKKRARKQLNLTKVKVLLKPNCLVQISCKSDNK